MMAKLAHSVVYLFRIKTGELSENVVPWQGGDLWNSPA